MRLDGKTHSLILGLILLIAPVTSSAGIDIALSIGPPSLPVYVQPSCPTDGYHWIPGYWAYGPAGYFWVPA